MSGLHSTELPESSVLDKVASTPWARTLWQGFVVDALVAIGLGLAVLLGDGDITSPTFWSAVGILVGKSFLTSVASWLTRFRPSALPAAPDVE